MPSHKKARKCSNRKAKKSQVYYDPHDVRLWLKLAKRWNRNIQVAARMGAPYAMDALKSLQRELKVQVQAPKEENPAATYDAAPDTRGHEQTEDGTLVRSFNTIAMGVEIIFKVACEGSLDAKKVLVEQADFFLQKAGTLAE